MIRLSEISPGNAATSQAAEGDAICREWLSILQAGCDTLRDLAGTTEDEFLQIGARMQDFYLRSTEVASKANYLVELVSGEQVHGLTGRLRQLVDDTNNYLISARNQSAGSSQALEKILELLGQVGQPLESFQKMTKALRMLGISTKIESSRLGELGQGFLTLAMDVDKLSQLVSEKSSRILEHRHSLSSIIGENLRLVRVNEAAQDREISGLLERSARGVEELQQANLRCSNMGTLISSLSGEVSENISDTVSSMQMHDMTRQQVEHILEALQRLSEKLAQPGLCEDHGFRRLVMETGDVCELQAAQLRFASSELCGAVRSIVDNLNGIVAKQATMAGETLSVTTADNATEGSFIDAMNRDMARLTGVLQKCAQADRDLTVTLSQVGDTMQEITGFVTDIEDIGSEIDLIALNSQIKAAHTGREGAALGVLAEAIKRLSVEAVTQTESVAGILLQINQSNESMFQDATCQTDQLGKKISLMEEELGSILNSLGAINADLLRLLAQLNQEVTQLNEDIQRTTAGMDVHERVSEMSNRVLTGLDSVVARAREIEPASTEFKDNLRHMEQRYTMQSERHIHEAIARKRSGLAVPHTPVSAAVVPAKDESEFGDNVDLF